MSTFVYVRQVGSQANVYIDKYQEFLSFSQGGCLDPQIDEFLRDGICCLACLKSQTFKEMPVDAEKKSQATYNRLRNEGLDSIPAFSFPSCLSSE